MLTERLKFKVTFENCKESTIAQKPLFGVKVGRFGCGAVLNSIITLSKLNFPPSLMDFSGGLCYSFGYREGLSQSFYIAFP